MTCDIHGLCSYLPGDIFTRITWRINKKKIVVTFDDKGEHRKEMDAQWWFREMGIKYFWHMYMPILFVKGLDLVYTTISWKLIIGWSFFIKFKYQLSLFDSRFSKLVSCVCGLYLSRLFKVETDVLRNKEPIWNAVIFLNLNCLPNRYELWFISYYLLLAYNYLFLVLVCIVPKVYYFATCDVRILNSGD